MEARLLTYIVAVASLLWIASFVAGIVVTDFEAGPYIAACSSVLGLAVGALGARAVMHRGDGNSGPK